MNTPAPVLVALDKFKGSVDADTACRAVADGIAGAGHPALTCPVADGGDGTLDALVSAGFRRIRAAAHDPLGAQFTASYARHGDKAVIELASVCGLAALPGGRREPWRSGTLGLGTLVRAAIDGGARHVVLALGGSASTDGGVGLLIGLGATVLDASGSPCSPDARGLVAARTVDLTTLDPRLRDVRFSVATDVTSPLTGPAGAAHLYGPQKGLSTDDTHTLDRGLAAWARLLAAATGVDVTDTAGAGAAGGTAAAAIAVLGARVISGADFVLDTVGFDQKLAGAGLVVTGEGSWDEQSEAGKAPMAVLTRTVAAGKPVVLVAGRIRASPARLAQLGITGHHQLLDLQPDPALAMRQAPDLLRRTGALLITNPRTETPAPASRPPAAALQLKENP